MPREFSGLSPEEVGVDTEASNKEKKIALEEQQAAQSLRKSWEQQAQELRQQIHENEVQRRELTERRERLQKMYVDVGNKEAFGIWQTEINRLDGQVLKLNEEEKRLKDKLRNG
jgi:chromosome segregation ATPase